MKNKKSSLFKVSLKEQGIIDKDTAYSFFQTKLRPIFDPTLDEKQKATLVADISLNDLIYVYSLLVQVPIYGKPKKQVILEKIRYFFDSEQRTLDLAKNLRLGS